MSVFPGTVQEFILREASFIGFYPILLKILHTVLKQRLILLAEDVLADVLGVAFGVAHLAEDTAIRGSDALDRTHRAVRVVRDVHGRISVEVDILEGNLAVGNQAVDLGLRGDKAAFAVGNGDGVQVADLTGG